MPWTCSSCATEVGDDASGGACPTCGQRKTSWTIVQDKTRTMVVPTRKRFEPLRGEWDAPLDARDDAYAGATWLPTEVIPAVHVDAARALAAEGKLPAPRDLLVVREFPGGPADRALKVTVEFAQAAAQDHALPGPTGDLSPEGAVDARLLALWGASAPPDDVTFPGVSIIDVSEETPEGHAPTIKVVALKRPARQLRVVVSTGVYRGLMIGMFFDTDLAFMLPTAVPAMKRLREYYDEHPGVEVLVVGHTDTTGAKDHNLVLSNERAEAVAAYLRDDVEHWAGYFTASRGVSKVWGTREVQWMLSALPDDGERFYVGPPSGVNDPATTDGVKRFQAWSNETRGTTLDQDGIAGPLTRRELVASYMEIDGTTLPEGTVLKTHGCGEFHPAVDAGDGANVAENRRVELFLFDPPGIRPQPGACPDPGCPEYPQWLAAVIHTIDLTIPRPPSTIVGGARLPSLCTFGRTFPKPTCLPALREVARRLAEDPTLVALVVGHADPVGGDFVNLALSTSRAEAVRSLLTNDVADLRRRFEAPDPVARWDFEEVQWMLSTRPVGGEVSYPGFVDGFNGALTHHAIGWFQFAEGLQCTRTCDEVTLMRLISRYVQEVPRVDPTRVRALGCSSWHEPAAFGTGEDPGELDERDPRHRRVEVFLFKGVMVPPPEACRRSPHVSCVAYDSWVRAVEQDLAPAPVERCVLMVTNLDEEPLRRLDLEVFAEREEGPVEVARGRTDELGLLALPLSPGLYRVQAADRAEPVLTLVHVHHDEVGAGYRVALPV